MQLDIELEAKVQAAICGVLRAYLHKQATTALRRQMLAEVRAVLRAHSCERRVWLLEREPGVMRLADDGALETAIDDGFLPERDDAAAAAFFVEERCRQRLALLKVRPV